MVRETKGKIIKAIDELKATNVKPGVEPAWTEVIKRPKKIKSQTQTG